MRVSMACSKAVTISLSSLNGIPRNCFFSFGNKKSQELQSGEDALHFHIVPHDFPAKIHL